MQITCSHCQRNLNLPDEKIPAQAFALTCPGCQNRIQVDPAKAAESPVTPAAPVAPDPAAVASATPAPATPAPTTGGEIQFESLLTMRDPDKDLFDSIYPAAAVVALGSAAPQPFEAGLRHLGMKEVYHFSDLPTATRELLEHDFSILVILFDRATAPPFEPLKPLYELPLSTRRDTFVVLVADNVRSLDGQTAFYLQLNCLVATQEIARFPLHVQRALLFHLRHYRHWGIRDDDQ